MKKYIGAGFVAFGLLFSISFVAVPAQASSLTSTQVSAIMSLLQAFGADQSTINNVSAALGGSESPSHSCSDFTSVKYGDFDNNPGGRVSQLQIFLGISPSSFGFGTYGRKTQAAWNNKCGDQAAPLHLPLDILTPQPIPPTVVPTPHPEPGPQPVVPSATIDQSSLTTSSLTPTITGHASGVTAVYVKILNYEGARMAQANAAFNSTTGVWSFPVNSTTETLNTSGYLSLNAPGTYSVVVYGLVAGSSVQLTTGTLTIASVNTNPQPISSSAITIASVQQPPNTIAPQGAIVPFTKFSIDNLGSADVVVSSMQFKQVGSGSDSVFRGIEVTDDAGDDLMVPNYSDGSLFNSSHITSGVAPLIIHGGQIKTFTVSGWMQSDLSSHATELISLSLINLGSTAGVTINGLLGITGAQNTINSSLNVCYPPQTATYGYKCWGGH